MAVPVLSAVAVSKSFPILGGALRAQRGRVDALREVTCALASGEAHP